MSFRRRPSDAARWMRCAGSLRFTQGYPKESSTFADEGTVAHHVREQCLEWGFDAYDFLGFKMTLNGVTYECDEDMAGFLQPGIDEIREFEGQMFVEHYVDTTHFVGFDDRGQPQGGTLDTMVVGKKLFVQSDLKYGAGVAVQAVDNDQQMVYALSFWHTVGRFISDATDFLIIIDQPRNSAGGGYWHVTLDQLLAYGEKLKERAKACEDPNAPLTPGEAQCKWCPAANVPGRPGGCSAHHEWIAANIDLRFDDLDEMDEVGLDWSPPVIASLSPERRAHIVRRKGAIEQWLEKLHSDELAARIANGPSFGLKAVAGRRPPQKWRDEPVAAAYLETRLPSLDQLYNKKLISPSQGEKILGMPKNQHFPSALVDRGEPKPVLVPEADKRPSLMTVDEKFDE